MPSTPRIRIDKPCGVAWSSMTPQDQGRHCKACDKVVNDFSALSTEALIDRLRTLPSGSCGRLRTAQLASVNQRRQTSSSHALMATTLAAGLGVAGLAHGQSAEDLPPLQRTEVGMHEDESRKQSTPTVPTIDPESVYWIEGWVSYAESGVGVDHARVQVIGEQGLMATGLTDSAGFYAIRIHKDSIEQVHSITASSFLTEEAGICPKLEAGVASAGHNIALKQATIHFIAGLIVVEEPRHVRIRRRVWWWLSSLFGRKSDE